MRSIREKGRRHTLHSVSSHKTMAKTRQELLYKRVSQKNVQKSGTVWNCLRCLLFDRRLYLKWDYEEMMVILLKNQPADYIPRTG